MPELDEIFAVGGVLPAVSGGVDRFSFRVVQSRMHTSGKEECPADSDRTEGIEFVGVINDLRFERRRNPFRPEPVRQYRAGDVPDQLRLEPGLFQDRNHLLRSELGVA